MKPKFLKPMEAPMGKPITVRLPVDLQLRYDRVRARAEEEGWTFTTTDIFIDAIKNCCEEMEEYLEKVGRENRMAEKSSDSQE